MFTKTQAAIAFLFLLATFSLKAQTADPSTNSSPDSLPTEAQLLNDIISAEQNKSPDSLQTKSVQSKGLFSEIPDGLIQGQVTPDCDPRSFENSIFTTKPTAPKDYFKIANDYMLKCGDQLSRLGVNGLPGLLNFTKVQYKFFSNPQVQRYNVPLANGTVVPGILALKKETKPRPLIVVRCGTFCTPDESNSLMNYMINLFDQAPFNVLILSNFTGIEYIMKNNVFYLGGWQEGYENLQVANWMRDNSEFKDRISSVHLMGISLGGNSTVFGAQYNDLNLRPDGTKTFNSATAICPVVDLRATLEKLYAKTLIGPIYSDYTKQQIKISEPYLPDLAAELDLAKDVDNLSMSDYLGHLAVTSLSHHNINITEDEFFQNNNFLNLNIEVKTPLLLLAAKDDILVDNVLNIQAFANDAKYKNSDTAGVINLDYGSHCAYSEAYGFPVVSALIRNFVLLNSPEFTTTYAGNNKAWGFGFPKLKKTELHVGQSWKFKSGSDTVKLIFTLFDSSLFTCKNEDPFNAPDRCLEDITYKLSTTDIDFLGAYAPTTDAEAESLTRQFNAKVEFQSANSTILGTSASEFDFVWRSGY